MDKDRFYQKCNMFLQNLKIPTEHELILLADIARMEEHANRTNYKMNQWHGFTIFNRKKKFQALNTRTINNIVFSLLKDKENIVILPIQEYHISIGRKLKTTWQFDRFLNKLQRRYYDRN